MPFFFYINLVVLSIAYKMFNSFKLLMSGPKEAHRGAAVAAAMGPKGD